MCWLTIFKVWSKYIYYVSLNRSRILLSLYISFLKSTFKTSLLFTPIAPLHTVEDTIILNKFYSRLTKPMMCPEATCTTNSNAYLAITFDQFEKTWCLAQGFRNDQIRTTQPFLLTSEISSNYWNQLIWISISQLC